MKMKHLTRWAAALGMAVLLLCGSAFAAGENTIAVQLNGEELTFTDAVPQVKDQRTFLPFRAVFEAMGAEVGNEGNVITATLGDKTLTMTIGETAATVKQLGMETPITMDVAPYVDAATWRTYVPVRFAAQAFGYTVGWDQEAYTAILIDPAKVMKEAMEGKQFTYLEKLSQYSEKYNKGIWDMTMDMTGSVSVMGANMPLSAAVTGTTQNQTKMSMDVNMKMDMTQLLQLVSMLGQNVDMTAEDRAMIESLAVQGIDMSMRGDMEAGKLYMMMGGSLMEEAGIPADTWFLMDMGAIYGQLGIDWKQVMNASKSVDMVALMAETMAADRQFNKAATAYGEMKAMMEKLVGLVADDAFVKDGNDYVLTLDLGELAGEELGGEAKLVLTLTMRRNEAVGYALALNATAANAEMGLMSMNMTMALDEKDQLTANFTVNAGQLMGMELDMDAKYTEGKNAPEVTPPAGAVVLPLDQMMDGNLGVIGQ